MRYGLTHTIFTDTEIDYRELTHQLNWFNMLELSES